MDLTHYTNVPQLYTELGLEKYNCALWHCHDANASLKIAIDSPLSIVKSIASNASWKTADKIFVIGQECVTAELTKFDKRIHCWDSMSLQNNNNLHFNPFWLHYVKWIEHSTNAVPKLSRPTETTPKYIFDCLLGLARPNKSFVADFVTQNNLTDRVLFSFFEKNNQWLQGHNYDDVKFTNTSQDNINYGGRMTAMKSLFVPYLIYNNSWFSIVAETRPDINFITEKTAKALIGRRLFVMFSGPRHLELLKTMGFRTFDNVIDESYDLEQDNVQRWTMAAKQIKYLLQQDPEAIYNAILPRLTHNQELLLNTDWIQLLNTSIVDIAQS